MIKIKKLDDYGNELLDENGCIQFEEIERDKIIEELLDDDIDTIIHGYEIAYLSDILREGFIGYNKYTDQELEQEYLTRIRHII